MLISCHRQLPVLNRGQDPIPFPRLVPPKPPQIVERLPALISAAKLEHHVAFGLVLGALPETDCVVDPCTGLVARKNDLVPQERLFVYGEAPNLITGLIADVSTDDQDEGLEEDQLVTVPTLRFFARYRYPDPFSV